MWFFNPYKKAAKAIGIKDLGALGFIGDDSTGYYHLTCFFDGTKMRLGRKFYSNELVYWCPVCDCVLSAYTTKQETDKKNKVCMDMHQEK